MRLTSDSIAPKPVRGAPAPAPRDSWLGRFGPGVLLIVAVIAVYFPAFSHGFIWDDDLHVTANPRMLGWAGLRDVWTTAAANYFPLVLTNFWIQHALWGLQPFGYHAVTIACHIVSAILLWRVLLALRLPGAWFGAALWALHPVQVESVAWISELKNTQSAIFFLLSIWFWLRWLGPDASSLANLDGAPRRRDYVLALVCALLALLSKPSTVTLPVVLALLAWWRRGAVRWRDVLAVAPLFALSAIASGWTIWEQRVHSGAEGVDWSQTLPERIAIAGHVAWFYLGKLIWPEQLVFIYPRWTPATLSFVPFVAAVLVLAALWWRRSAWHAGLIAVVFFGALLFPVLGFFSVYFFRYSFVGDHFQYLASMGPLALLGAAIASVPRRAGLALGVALLGAFGVLSWRQTWIYRDKVALWQATTAGNPAAVMPWINLGDALSREQRLPEAIAAYREALRRRPDDADSHNDLGCLLTMTGDHAGAIHELEQAVSLRPNYAASRNNLGNALHAAGRVEEAIAQYTEAIRLKPAYTEALGNLGNELVGAGRRAEAIPHFEAVLRLAPADPKARDDLVRALQAQGAVQATAARWREAADLFARAVALQPNALPAQTGLAIALVNSDRLAEAVPVFEAALLLDPKSAELHDNFGQVLNALGRQREALEQLDQAARLRQR